MTEFMGLLRVDCYDSLNFKIGINNDRLRIALGMLIEFVKLDRRGGIFSKPVMERSVTSTVGGDEQFKKHSVEAGFDPREACGIVAYKIRVMLSHLRIKHDTCKECDDPSAFDAAYSLMKVPKDLREQKKHDEIRDSVAAGLILSSVFVLTSRRQLQTTKKQMHQMQRMSRRPPSSLDCGTRWNTRRF